MKEVLIEQEQYQHPLDIRPVNNTLSSFGSLLASWLRKLSSKGNRIVMLIDEYNAPVTNYIEYPTFAQRAARLFKPFYEAIKTHTDQFRLVFVTWVSKFSSRNQFTHLIEEMAHFATLFGFLPFIKSIDANLDEVVARWLPGPRE